MSKYEPLNRFLSAQAAGEVPLSFAEVERTLGFRLPKSARQYAPWWANEVEGGHVQARAWLGAGWKTSRVDLAGERVVFVRAAAAPSSPASAADNVPIVVDLASLPLAAAKLLKDYAAEAQGDMSQAVSRALLEAARARRARIIDRFPMTAVRTDVNSVDLIREDRDER